MRILCVGIFILCSVGVARAQQEPTATLAKRLPEPFWSSHEMVGDPLFFIKEPNQPAATSHLLFQPAGNLRLTDAAGTKVYVAGTDYLWEKGTNTVTLTANSPIFFKTREEMTPPIGAPMAYGKTASGQAIFFKEGYSFNDWQVRATYQHNDRWDETVSSPAANPLPRTAARLKSGAPLRMVILGDSISTGANATGAHNKAPFQPPYFELVAADLRARFTSAVTLTNLSAGGKRSDWGITQVPQVAEAKPDLLIVAFGMNDREPSQQYAENTGKIIAQVQSACPECDIILVASMTGNPLAFEAFSPTRFTGYRDALRGLVQRNVALADVTTVWMELLQKKSFSDLTGNGVNHPNDFGHMIYADVISSLFGPK